MKPLPKRGEIADEAPQEIAEFHVSSTERFSVREDGLRHVKLVQDADGKPQQQVSRLTFEHFHIKGRLRPCDADNQHGLLIEMGEREITVPKASIATENDLGKWLADYGIRFDPDHRKKLLRYVILSDAIELRAYTRCGWHADGAFVVGDTIIRGEGYVMQTDTFVSEFAQKGDLDQWRSDVLPLASMKPGWIFGILVGLSSPLLHLLGSTTGYAFNLHGRSSIGKTVALAAAANVWGKPTQDGCLRAFNTTSNAMEGLAEGHSDIGLVLDEMKKGDPRLIAESAYLLANGQGKERMKSNADMQRQKRWRLNTFMSSEKTYEDIFAALGEHQAAGQIIRAIDVDGEALLPIIDRADLRRFESALLACYGVLGPAFVRKLVAIPEDRLRAMWDDATVALYSGDDQRIERVAAGFALLVVAGQIMEIDTGVAMVAFKAWEASGVHIALDDNSAILQEIVEFVDARLNATIIPLREVNDEDRGMEDSEGEDRAGTTGEAGGSSRDRDGWYENGGEDRVVYLTSKTLKTLRQGHGTQAFNKFLMDNRLIIPGSKTRPAKKVPKLSGSVSAYAFHWQAVLDYLDERTAA